MIRSILRHLYAKIRSFVLSKRFLYLVASIVAVFLLMNYVVMPWYVYHGGTLTVPDVTRMQFAQAQETLSNMGLVAVEGDTILDNTLPAGAVITQNPRANSTVKYGRHIYLTVCGGEVTVSVPSLRGRSLRDARFALERNGLILGETHYAASDSSPVNTIISQSVSAAEKVKKGSPIAVTVSTGSATTTIEVPNLTGKSILEAEKILEYFGLQLGNITYQVNAELLPNTIVDQFPQAGTAVDSGKVVDLFVAKAGKVLDER
jgi:serine/threonine-protein kinase